MPESLQEASGPHVDGRLLAVSDQVAREVHGLRRGVATTDVWVRRPNDAPQVDHRSCDVLPVESEPSPVPLPGDEIIGKLTESGHRRLPCRILLGRLHVGFGVPLVALRLDPRFQFFRCPIDVTNPLPVRLRVANLLGRPPVRDSLGDPCMQLGWHRFEPCYPLLVRGTRDHILTTLALRLLLGDPVLEISLAVVNRVGPRLPSVDQIIEATVRRKTQSLNGTLPVQSNRRVRRSRPEQISHEIAETTELSSESSTHRLVPSGLSQDHASFASLIRRTGLCSLVHLHDLIECELRESPYLSFALRPFESLAALVSIELVRNDFREVLDICGRTVLTGLACGLIVDPGNPTGTRRVLQFARPNISLDDRRLDAERLRAGSYRFPLTLRPAHANSGLPAVSLDVQ